MSEGSENKVSVRILTHVGQWSPGQVVELPAAQAAAMCEVRKRQDGHGLVDYRTAMTMEEFERIQALPVDLGGITQGEMTELGLINKVETPLDPAFEQKCKSIMEGKPMVSEERDEEADKASLRGKKKFKSA